jgi:DNA-directed RNA polymerase specialized sigma24 family protein
MKNLLLHLLNARDEHERRQCLDQLLTIHVAPIIKGVLLKQLGFYVSVGGKAGHNRDAEDLFQEAMTRIRQRLSGPPPSLLTIENCESYFGRVVSNVCMDFLRAKSPARTRLKNNLRDLFRHYGVLASWQTGDEILCGFAAWQNTQSRRELADDTELEAFQLARFAREEVRDLPLARIVCELFDWIGAPVEFDDLVTMVARLQNINDQPLESLNKYFADNSEVHFPGSIHSNSSDVEITELLRRLWNGVKRLPAPLRDTFVFLFQDQNGQDLFTLLLAAGVVSWKELAEGMGRSVVEIAKLRRRMPMDRAMLESELQASRTNVDNWKLLALRRLKDELK